MNAPSPQSKFSTTAVPGKALVFVFHLTEIREMETLNELEDEVFEVLRGDSSPRVVLDLERVGSISSFGLGLLVQIHKECQRLGKRLIFCNLSTNIDQLFRIAHLNTLFVIVNTREEAIDG